MTDICSVWAYHEILDSGYIGKRQAQYLSVFSKEIKPYTHRQASLLVNKEFGIRVPERNGRIAELEERGFLRKYDQVVCDYSRKVVNRWIYTGKRSGNEESSQKICCPKCKGVGTIYKTIYKD